MLNYDQVFVQQVSADTVAEAIENGAVESKMDCNSIEQAFAEAARRAARAEPAQTFYVSFENTRFYERKERIDFVLDAPFDTPEHILYREFNKCLANDPQLADGQVVFGSLQKTGVGDSEWPERDGSIIYTVQSDSNKYDNRHFETFEEAYDYAKVNNVSYAFISVRFVNSQTNLMSIDKMFARMNVSYEVKFPMRDDEPVNILFGRH